MANGPTQRGDDDQAQFVRLLTQNERRIYGFILSLVPNWNDADEILQETNVTLWKEFDKFQPGTNFAAWAIRVAHFHVLTWRKKVARGRLVFDQQFVDYVADQHENDDSLAEARHQALGSCIDELTVRNQELLSRCYAAEATIANVAESLERTTDSVYKALQRIRLALHKCVNRRLAQDDIG